MARPTEARALYEYSTRYYYLYPKQFAFVLLLRCWRSLRLYGGKDNNKGRQWGSFELSFVSLRILALDCVFLFCACWRPFSNVEFQKYKAIHRPDCGIAVFEAIVRPQSLLPSSLSFGLLYGTVRILHHHDHHPATLRRPVQALAQAQA